MADVGQVGEAFINLRYRMDHLDSDLRTATSKIGQQLRGVEGGVGELGRTAEKAGKGISGALGGAFSRLQEPVAQLGSAIAGIGAASLFTDLVKTAGDFELQMKRVQAVSGATDEELRALSEQAKQLGADTSFSASKAADAMMELASSGFSVQQTMDAVPGVMDLAAAAQVDLGTAAATASDTLKQFGLEIGELGRVNDVLVGTVNRTSADITDLTYTLKYVGPVAHSAGLGLEETAAAIGTLSESGIRSEQAGTTLRSMLSTILQMEDPPKRVAGVMKSLGIEFANVDLKTNSFNDVLGYLSTKLTSTVDVLNLFGVEAQSGANILLKETEATKALAAGLQNVAGEAKKAGEANMSGFAGSMEELSGAFESLKLAIADSGILAGVTSIVRVFGDLVAKLSELDPVILKFGGAFVGVAALIAPVTAAVGAFVFVAGTVGAPVLAAAAALAALGAAAITFSDEIGTGFAKAKEYLTSLLADWNGTFAGLGAVFQRVGTDITAGLGSVSTALAAWANTVKTGIVGTLTQISPELGMAANAAITAYATSWTTGVETILAAIRGAFAIVITAAREALAPLNAMATEVTAAFGRSFAEGIGALAGSVLATIATFAQSLSAGMANAVASMLTAWTSGLDGADFAAGVRMVIGRIAEALSALPTIYVEYVTAFATGFANALSTAFGEDIIGQFRAGLDVLKKAIAGGLTGMKDTAIRLVKAMVDGIKAQVTGRLNKVLEGIKKPIEDVKAFFDDLYQSVVGGSSFTDLVTGVGTKTAQLQGLMVAPMQDMTGQVSGMFTTMSDQAVADAARVGQAMNAAAMQPANGNRAGGGRVPAGLPGGGQFRAAGAAGDQQEAQARQQRIVSIQGEIAELQRLQQAQVVGSAEYERVAQQIAAERAARELGTGATQAERDAIANLVVQQELLADAIERSKRIESLQAEVDEMQRLNAAAEQGIDAYYETVVAIEQERAVRELGIGATKEEIEYTKQLVAEKVRLNTEQQRLQEAQRNSFGPGALKSLTDYVEESREYGRIAGELISPGIKAAENDLANFMRTGEMGFDNLEKAAEDLKDMLIQIAAQQMIAGVLGGGMGMGSMLFGGPPRGYAKGGVVSGPGISAYSGSIVRSPTVFPFARGIGLMGEAGPEAILPLKRGASGRLGVEVAANDTAANDAAPRVTVQVFDQRSGGAPVQQQTSRGADGSETIRLMIRDEVKRTIASGDADKAMQRYGNRPQLQR